MTQAACKLVTIYYYTYTEICQPVFLFIRLVKLLNSRSEYYYTVISIRIRCDTYITII